MAEQLKKLISQNEIARRLGVGKSTLSRWIKRAGVSPERIDGQQKFYNETVLEQLEQLKKAKVKVKKSGGLNTETLEKQLGAEQSQVEYLKQLITTKDKQINQLTKQLEDASRQLADKDKQIKELNGALIDQNKALIDFGAKFAKLADQSQKLNLLDKPKQEPKEQEKKPVEPEPEQPTTPKKKKPFWSKFF